MHSAGGDVDACHETECQIEGEEEQDAADSSGEGHRLWRMIRESKREGSARFASRDGRMRPSPHELRGTDERPYLREQEWFMGWWV
jgi:hypothetical protein